MKDHRERPLRFSAARADLQRLFAARAICYLLAPDGFQTVPGILRLAELAHLVRHSQYLCAPVLPTGGVLRLPPGIPAEVSSALCPVYFGDEAAEDALGERSPLHARPAGHAEALVTGVRVAPDARDQQLVVGLLRGLAGEGAGEPLPAVALGLTMATRGAAAARAVLAGFFASFRHLGTADHRSLSMLLSAYPDGRDRAFLSGDPLVAATRRALAGLTVKTERGAAIVSLELAGDPKTRQQERESHLRLLRQALFAWRERLGPRLLVQSLVASSSANEPEDPLPALCGQLGIRCQPIEYNGNTETSVAALARLERRRHVVLGGLTDGAGG